MVVIVPSALRFPRSGTTRPLDANAVDELLALARRVQSSQGEKSVLETFKKHFSRASGDGYAPSSDLSWAETDFWRHAQSAADDAPNFIAAFCNACEELEGRGASIPDLSLVNEILASYGCPYQVRDGELIDSAPLVESPKVALGPRDSVAKALADATALLAQSGAVSGIDRAHTALHGYLIHLCSAANITVPTDASTTRLFKELRKNHSAFIPQGNRAADITNVLHALASVLDSLSPIRNKASLVHPNELLEEPEAMIALNATRTLFRYIQDCLQRNRDQNAS